MYDDPTVVYTVLCDLSIIGGVILNLMYKKLPYLMYNGSPPATVYEFNCLGLNCNHIIFPYSYSLYEHKSHALMEYNGGLEKAIRRDSELLSEVNDAFFKSHPLLAQKVVTRSARAAVGADVLVSKHRVYEEQKQGHC